MKIRVSDSKKSMIGRRELLVALGMSALGASRAAVAQQPVPRVGWLSLDQAGGSPFFEPFRTGLRDLGWVEGRNVTIEARWADGSPERLDLLAAELIASRPQIIVTQGATIHAVRRIRATMPIVFGFSGDPVEAGLVDNLARPGRNFTGVSFLSLELVGKRIELLKEVIPTLTRTAILANPEHPGEQAELRASQAAAKVLGLTLEYFPARGLPELEAALSAISRSRSQAIVVFPDAVTLRNSERIARLGLEHRMPAVGGWARFAESGCLMTYGPNLGASFRRVATYVDRILKGAKPADLPVELPTSVELVVNLKTAGALGIRVPQSVLARADQVIE
jgi:putative tryptophan/tyrosine transport system substrate-binding protein